MARRYARKHRNGYCAECGKMCSVRTNGTVFSHARVPSIQYPSGGICGGSGNLPSFIIENGETIPVIFADPQPLQAATEVVSEAPLVRLGSEYPVYTEAGYVVGRGRVEVGRITILGPRWAARTA